MLQHPSCCRRNSIYARKTEKEKLVQDEFLLVIFQFISSFVETERSAYRKVVVEYSSEKHYYNYCKLICQIQISIQHLEVSIQCRRIDLNVGESTQTVQAKRLRSCRRNDLDVGESTCRRNDLQAKRPVTLHRFKDLMYKNLTFPACLVVGIK